MGKINIVRPDGSTFTGTTEELAKLQLLGDYKPETPDQALERAVETGNEKEASAFGAAVAGIASGVTLGASDLLATPQDINNAKYEPGWRIAGEITGAIGGSLTGVGPAGAVSKAALKTGNAVGRGVKGAAAIGVIEGAAGGLQATISNATLSGDPLTSESVLAGMGWGSLFGLGLGVGTQMAAAGLKAVGKKMTTPPPIPHTKEVTSKMGVLQEIEEEIPGSVTKTRVPATLEDISEETVTREIRDYIRPVDEDAFNQFRATIDEFSVKGYTMGDELEKALKTAESNFAASEAAGVGDIKKLKSSASTINNAAKDVSADAFFRGLAQKEVKTMTIAGTTASKAIDAGDYEKAKEALKRYHAAIRKVESITGYKSGLADIKESASKSSLQSAVASAKVAVETKASAKILAGFPKTLDAFTEMSPQKAEGFFAAIENTLRNQGDEVSSFRSGLEMTTKNLVEKSGIVADGSVVEQLKKVWMTGRLGTTTEMITTVEELVRHDRSKQMFVDIMEDIPGRKVTKQKDVVVDRIDTIRDGKKEKHHMSMMDRLESNLVAGTIAASVGGPMSPVIYYGVKSLLYGGNEGLSALKSSVQNRIASAAKTSAAILKKPITAKIASAFQPLYTKLDGSRGEEKSHKEAAKKRIEEITEMAPNIKNILYTAVEPLIGNHPELAVGIHTAAVKAFDMFFDMIPKDPGMAFSGMKSLWEPNPLQMVEFAKMKEVFEFPVAVAEEAIAGNIDVLKVNALKAMWPEVYSYLKSELLSSLDFSKLSYQQQGLYSMLLDIPIHSSFRPEATAESQRIFMEVPPEPKKGGGNNPSGKEPATTSQSLAA